MHRNCFLKTASGGGSQNGQGAVPRMGRGHQQVSLRRREVESTLLESEPGSRELRNLKPDSWAINPCQSGSRGGDASLVLEVRPLAAKTVGVTARALPWGHC